MNMSKDRFYQGKIPCSVCKERKPRWGKDNPCSDCLEVIRLGKLKQQELENDSGEYVAVDLHFYNTKDLRINNPEFNFDRPNYSHIISTIPYHSEVDYPEFNSTQLNVYYNAFMESICNGEKRGSTSFGVDSSAGFYKRVFLSRGQAIAFRDFRDYLSRCIWHWEKSKKEEGRNLLIGLAKKEIQMTDFL